MMRFKRWLEQADWDQWLANVRGEQQIIAALEQAGVQDVEVPRLLTRILVFNHNGQQYVIDDFNDPTPEEADEWFQKRLMYGDSYRYVESPDFNADFWQQVRPGFVLYHGTEKAAWPVIQRTGLSPRNKTRGIANRGTGSAVFTSDSYDTTAYYYDLVIEINVGQMKVDGYMPEVSQEEPIQEAELERSLAWAIGVEYEPELESGLDPGTVIFYGIIPPQYLKAIS